jgi:hypothetical protein
LDKVVECEVAVDVVECEVDVVDCEVALVEDVV